MSMKTVSQVRSEFLSYFARQGHEVVQSSGLVPQNDPTLLFTNSGMVQFKNLFLGTETRPYKRATSAQKCVRAGGKHNDLDNVGYTSRHHTFFEMLGNFSFGDYFKADAIPFAWEVVTKVYGLPKDRLLVTVYSEDDEAASIWKKAAGLSDDRIIRIPTSDNFWMMGETGPCGPCTEIFFDHGDKIQGGPPGSADQDGDRFIEIWNLVFMQYEQIAPGNRVPLPKPSIDTGMGLERISAILQGKHDNYDIDILREIIEHVADLTGVDPDGAQRASHRVIADHLRTAAFLIAEGVLPGNEGRSYVLRRIMRRGMRHAHLLGAKDPLMYRLLPTLIGKMGEAYPELKRGEALVTETLKLEETRFKRTLETGLKLLDEETAKLTPGQKLPGEQAFKLYDTYGFPLDLTQDALRAKSIEVDTAGFESCMQKQREDSRKAWVGTGDAFTEKLWFDLADRLGSTEFLGYERESAEGQITALIQDGKEVSEAGPGTQVVVMTNQTPFYGESGGQVGDSGMMTAAGGVKIRVTDTHKMLGKIWAHHAVVESGMLKVGTAVEMKVDATRRAAIRAHHSATHLLHAALHRHVGAHVTQKGSLVSADRLRFDISQPTPLTPEQTAAVEAEVNAEIRANAPVQTRLMSVDEAMASGAMALFGEKYGDEVRVVSMGTPGPDGKRTFSVELCGGTHVRQTGDIGLFKIVSESAVSAGVRRIEALSGQAALDYYNAQESLLEGLCATLKVGKADLLDRVQHLLDERRKLEQDLSNLRREMASGGGGSGSGPDVREVAGVKFAGRVLQGVPAKDLKPIVDDLKQKLGSAVIALVAVEGDKASIVVGVTGDLTGRFSAVELVKVGAQALGGTGGGGRPDMAQAGGPNAGAANDAVVAIEKAMAQ